MRHSLGSAVVVGHGPRYRQEAKKERKHLGSPPRIICEVEKDPGRGLLVWGEVQKEKADTNRRHNLQTSVSCSVQALPYLERTYY